MAVRLRGDWEGWLRFFLRGVAETAEQATVTAERIFEPPSVDDFQVPTQATGA
jgi:hypothetical protein